MDMRYPEFAKRFKKACEAANMPQPQNSLGKKLGVSGAMIHNYRNGLKLPGTDTLSRISQKLNVSIDWLVNGVIGSELTLEEKKFLDNYRQLSDKSKNYIDQVIEREAMYVSSKLTSSKSIESSDEALNFIKSGEIRGALLDAIDKLKFEHPESAHKYEEAESQLLQSFSRVAEEKDNYKINKNTRGIK